MFSNHTQYVSGIVAVYNDNDEQVVAKSCIHFMIIISFYAYVICPIQHFTLSFHILSWNIYI